MTTPQRKTWRSRFIEDVKTFQAITGMEFSAIFFKAIGNRRNWDRMMKGGSITVDKADEVYTYMNQVGAAMEPPIFFNS